MARALFGTTPQQDPAAWQAGNPVDRAGLRPFAGLIVVRWLAGLRLP